MRFHIVLFLVVLFGLGSCHFYDDRVRVVNEAQDDLLFAIAKLDPVNRNDILSPFFKVESGAGKSIPLLRNLDYNLLDCDSVVVIQISPEMEKSVLRENEYYEYEHILHEKTYSFYAIATNKIVEDGGAEVKFSHEKFEFPMH